MKEYKVSYMNNGISMVGIYRAETETDVTAYQTTKGREIVSIKEATEADMREATKKRMPIVTCPHVETAEKEKEEMTNTTNTTSTTKEQRAENFRASEKVMNRVTEYVRKSFDLCTKEAEKKAASDAMKAAEKSDGLESDAYKSALAVYQAACDAFETFKSQTINKWSWDDADKAMYSMYTNVYNSNSASKRDYNSLISMWFRAHDMDISADAELLANLRAEISGSKGTFRTLGANLIKTDNGVKCRTIGDLMGTFYNAVITSMLNCGVWDSFTIPQALKDRYTPKQKKRGKRGSGKASQFTAKQPSKLEADKISAKRHAEKVQKAHKAVYAINNGAVDMLPALSA